MHESVSHCHGVDEHEVVSSTELDNVLAVIARNTYAGRSGTQLTVTIAGTYRLSYCVRIIGDTLVGARLVLNGTPLASSDIEPNASGKVFCRRALGVLAAGDTTLRPYGLTAR